MSLQAFPRSVLVVLTALFACQGPSPTLDDEARQGVESEVREAVMSLMEAMNAHDADAVLSHYEQSDELTYVGVSDIRTGWDSFARAITPWYTRHADVTFQYEIVRVSALGPDAAFAVVSGSSTDVSSLVWTQVFARGDDGRWLIVHEHEAWPGAPEPRARHPM